MLRFISTILCLAAVHSAAEAADAPCPDYKPGEAYPWQTSGFMPGDKWADLVLTVDEKGRVTRCSVKNSNMDQDMRFFACRAEKRDGIFEPAMKDGQPVPHVVERRMTLPGMRHRDADAAARKRWFAEHPAERQSCYPR